MPSEGEAARGGVVRKMSSEESVFCCRGPVPVVEERYESGRWPPPRYVLDVRDWMEGSTNLKVYIYIYCISHVKLDFFMYLNMLTLYRKSYSTQSRMNMLRL